MKIYELAHNCGLRLGTMFLQSLGYKVAKFISCLLFIVLFCHFVIWSLN